MLKGVVLVQQQCSPFERVVTDSDSYRKTFNSLIGDLIYICSELYYCFLFCLNINKMLIKLKKQLSMLIN